MIGGSFTHLGRSMIGPQFRFLCHHRWGKHDPWHRNYHRQTKFAKVMFLHVAVCLQGGGHAWQGDVRGGCVCMARGHAWQGGVCGRGCGWQGGICGGGPTW